MSESSLIRVLSRGNRTEVSCVVDPADGGLVVRKRLLAFADVTLERGALFHEALVQHGARCAGVVPILMPELETVDALHEMGEVAQQTSSITRRFIPGCSFADLLADEASLYDLAAIHAWLGQLCEILQDVHETVGLGGDPLGIVHRDVTPGNVLIQLEAIADPTNRGIWLNDFGLSHVAAWGPLEADETLQGTRGMISPELIAGDQPTSRSDVFQVGLLLGLLLDGASKGNLRGQRPHDDTWRAEVIRVARTHPAGSALDEDPENRPTAGELARLFRAS